MRNFMLQAAPAWCVFADLSCGFGLMSLLSTTRMTMWLWVDVVTRMTVWVWRLFQIRALELPRACPGSVQLPRRSGPGALPGSGQPDGPAGHPAPWPLHLRRMGDGELCVWTMGGKVVRFSMRMRMCVCSSWVSK